MTGAHNYMLKTEIERMMTRLSSSLTTRKTVTLNRGEIVFYKGDVTTHIYLMVAGQATVQNIHSDGNIFHISSITSGSFLGDLEAISGNLINATTVVAQTDCTMLKFSTNDFLKALTLDNEFLLLVSRLLAQKMYHECFHLGDTLYKKGSDKLMLYIIKACKKEQVNFPLIIRKTRQGIASEVGVSVKTINRAIKSLCDQQLINVINGKINISTQDYQSLLDMANQGNNH